MLRYAFSFGMKKKWYNFYRAEAGHDRLASIDYRITPAIGFGYWFSDTDDLKIMTELGLGSQYTNYRDDTDDDTEMILVPRCFLEKRLFKNTVLSQNVVLYPSLEDREDYRIHSETALTNPINGHISLRVSFIDDFDSDSSGDIKKNDYRLISSLTHGC